MRHDVKIKRVISKYGLEGYGLYNLALESITESLSTGSPMPDLQETCEDIAEFYNGNTAKINEMMNYMINQSLFELDEMSGSVLCTKLYKFLDTSQTRSTELRAMIKGFKQANKPQLEDMSNTVSDSPIQSEIVCAESDRIRIRKEEELEKNKKKSKEKYNPQRDLLFFDDHDFKEVWKDYISVRTKKKAVNSDRAIRSVICKLKVYSCEDKVKAIEVLENSINGGWSDIYEPKGKSNTDNSITAEEQKKLDEEAYALWN
ncbi:MAG: DUF4373 domain-containing protein [Deltaproteobacteria bacterium]|nr:DUF4373 domain-containing protein [Deltaproteobacteria bacterium]